MMEILQYLHSTQCLVVKVGAEDIGEQSRSFRIEMLPTPSTIMLGGARPSLSDPALPMARVQVASTYGAVHLAGSHPHAQGRALLRLHPTVGRSMRTAAVNRPARMNAQQGAPCSRRDAVVPSQVWYPLRNEIVFCLGLRPEVPMVRSHERIDYFLTQSR